MYTVHHRLLAATPLPLVLALAGNYNHPQAHVPYKCKTRPPPHPLTPPPHQVGDTDRALAQFSLVRACALPPGGCVSACVCVGTYTHTHTHTHTYTHTSAHTITNTHTHTHTTLLVFDTRSPADSSQAPTSSTGLIAPLPQPAPPPLHPPSLPPNPPPPRLASCAPGTPRCPSCWHACITRRGRRSRWAGDGGGGCVGGWVGGWVG